MNKITLKLLLAIIVSVFIFSCKKTAEPDLPGNLSGEWKLDQMFDAYANGGKQVWYKIADADAHTLTFSEDGSFVRKENASGNFKECLGSYVFTSPYLEISSSCNSVTESITVSQLTTKFMILDRMGIEGVIKYKYVRL